MIEELIKDFREINCHYMAECLFLNKHYYNHDIIVHDWINALIFRAPEYKEKYDKLLSEEIKRAL